MTTSEVGVFGGADAPGALGDRVAQRVAARRSQLVLGIDPDPRRLWPGAAAAADAVLSDSSSSSSPPAARAGAAVAAHCRLVLDAAAEHCVAVKFQVACFERLGAPGWQALANSVADARRRGLLVVADAKRGDIDISARAYGQTFFAGSDSPFGRLPGLGADLLTASPLLGRDSLQALLDEARAGGGGLFVLARTSNPGAADLQDRPLRDGGTVSDAVARLIDDLGSSSVGASGLSDVGAVIGATAPEALTRLREAMPHAVVLLPGVGAQGASGEGLEAAFAPGPAGGLVTVSRAIVYAAAGDSDPAVAARAEAERLRGLLWDRYA